MDDDKPVGAFSREGIIKTLAKQGPKTPVRPQWTVTLVILIPRNRWKMHCY